MLFARARMSGQADHFAGFNGKIEVFENGFAGFIRKCHVVKLDAPFNGGHGVCGASVGYVGLRVEYFKDALGRRRGALEAVVEAAEAFNRAVKTPHVTA